MRCEPEKGQQRTDNKNPKMKAIEQPADGPGEQGQQQKPRKQQAAMQV